MARGPRLLGGWAVALLLLSDPVAAPAQVSPTTQDLSAIKVVIPSARGKKRWGRDALTSSLRKNLADGVQVVDHRDFRRQQRKLRLRGRAAFRGKNLARAGEAAGAQYVLSVRITRQRWLYTATARLIDTQTGQEKMNFRSQYYKPKEEAEDRGFRIARRTLLKFGELAEAGELQVGTPATERPGSEPLAFVPPADSAELAEGSPSVGGESAAPFDNAPFERIDDEEPAPDDGSAFSAGSPTSERVDNEPFRSDSDSPGADDSGFSSSFASEDDDTSSSFESESSGGFSSSASSGVVSEAPPTQVSKPFELLRIWIGAGAQFVRTYDLEGDTIANSEISHSLSPLGLVVGDVEFTVPSIPFYARVFTSFRPVSYSVETVDANPQVVEGSGTLINVTGLVGYQIGFSGNDQSSARLIPTAGIRAAIASAANEVNNVILDSTSLAAVGGILFRWPINDVLEIDVGVDGGYVFSYSEGPDTNSGDNGAGFMIGADLGAQIWLTDSIAVAIDNRFVLESVGLDGAVTRQLPAAESGLANASISTRDLFTSVGVVFRL